MAEYSYIGKGVVSGREYGTTGPFLLFGNCPALSFSVDEEEKSLLNSMVAGGGKLESLKRTTGTPIEMQLTSYEAANIAMVTGGNLSTVASGSASGEAITAYSRSVSPLLHIGPISVVVTGATLGDDYSVTNAGILWNDTMTIAEGTGVTVNYSYDGYNAVEALMNAAKEFEILFSGLNEARSGDAGVGYLHRVSFGKSGFSMISDDFDPMTLTGEILSDSTKTGTDSPYFKWSTVG